MFISEYGFVQQPTFRMLFGYKQLVLILRHKCPLFYFNVETSVIDTIHISAFIVYLWHIKFNKYDEVCLPRMK